MNYRYITVLSLLLLTACENTTMKSDHDEVSKINQKMVETKNVKSASQPKAPINTTSEAGQSRSLTEIAAEHKKPTPYECEEKFKNKNGVCEVPNQPHPKSLIKSETKK